MDGNRPKKIDHARLDDLRRGRGPVQEHVIDEFVAGRLSRRDFLRRGSAIGLSMPLLGGILAACGGSIPGSGSGSGAQPKGKAGATIKAGIYVPAAAINPITIADQGGLQLIGNVGEFLVFTDHQNNYHPWLAESWSPNADASVWTFKIRQGVKFNDGTPMTVDDVVYSFKTQSDPKSSANALSVFGGTLSPDGVKKVDDTTVAFHLDAPDGNFVDAVSEDNYNMIIVPKGFDYGDYQKKFPGTGRLMKESYTPNQGAVYVPNPHYWGSKALPSRVEFTFYAEEAPMAAALQAGSIDAMDQFSVATSPQLLNGSLNVISLKAATHRELSMRNDMGPFKNKLVRQAIALTLDRPAIVAALFKDQAVVGNDSPFAPTFKSYEPGVPQRKKDLARAKQLLAQAGVGRGFSTPLLTETTQEIPHFAQIVKQSAAQIGVDIKLTIETPTKYYGQAVFGKSDWLDGEMSLVDYGARGVPNVYLEAPLQSTNAKSGQGSWNAAHFHDPAYDKLSKEFVAAVDVSTQRKLAGQIQRLLLDETPIIFAYFYNYLTATQKNVTGVYPTAQSQFFLWNAAKS
ncbi:MAG TPA: ABC transporter substrate-binding protein [Streptosporangiaceae bacterium]|nr:ABC transporter substrate-binding protein [Streptosporangiaceae bacterium]